MATFGWLSQRWVTVLKGERRYPEPPRCLPTQTLRTRPNSPPQSFASSRIAKEEGGAGGQLRGLDESLNRTEEGHTGAMAIPKTTYLLSHNDSACQNNCQDTRPARNWLTPAPSNQEARIRVFVPPRAPHLGGLPGTRVPQTRRNLARTCSLSAADFISKSKMEGDAKKTIVSR